MQMAQGSETVPGQKYYSQKITDLYVLGEGYRPVEQQTTHRIVALEAIDRIHLPVSPGVIRLNLEWGKEVGDFQVPGEDDWVNLEVRLARHLAVGEAIRVAYFTSWFDDRPRPPRYRRSVAPNERAIEEFDLTVAFDRIEPPPRIWLGKWAGGQPDSELLSQELVQPTPMEPLEEEPEAAMHVAYVGPVAAGEAIGFFWEA